MTDIEKIKKATKRYFEIRQKYLDSIKKKKSGFAANDNIIPDYMDCF